MLLKIVSFIASIILLFAQSVAVPETGVVLVEMLGILSESRTV